VRYFRKRGATGKRGEGRSISKQCATMSLILTSFPEALFPEHKAQIKQLFEQRLKPANPDLI
jgi:hypothetical protein